MLGFKSASSLAALTALCAGAGLNPRAAMSREKEPPPLPAIVEVHTGHQACSVDLDSGTASKTGEGGVLILSSVEPGDHYLHISCPDGRKTSRFIVPSPGETLKVSSEDDLLTPGPEMDAAELRRRLHDHIQEAIRLRTSGRIDEAAEHLRDARRLDPDNSDLHRELGITFLLGKDWKRARIEMLEAIHSDPTDADAYNGLGYALEKMGMIDAAVEAFHIASRLDPSDSSYRRQYFDAIGRQAEQRAEQKKR